MTSTATELSRQSSEKAAAELRPVLVELIALALQGKQLHWNVEGPLFQPVHAQLDRIVDDARMWADEVAERMVSIGVAAAGQASDVVKESTLKALPEGSVPDRQAIALMTERVAAVAALARSAMNRLGELDLASQDLLIEVVRGLEKHLWMLRVQQS